METIENFKTNVGLAMTKDGIATPINIAVITACANLNSLLDLNLLSSVDVPLKFEYEVEYDPNIRVTKAEKSMKTEKEKEKEEQKKSAFYNCLKLKFCYGESKNISAKIFPNGSIQIAGNRNIETVYVATQTIYDFVKNAYEICGEELEPTFELTNVRIVLINSNFKLCRQVNQVKLKDTINRYLFDPETGEGEWRIATYQSEKYPGVNAKFLSKRARNGPAFKTKDGELKKSENKIPKKIEGQVSVFIFRSGSVSITGVKTSEELLEAYQSITQIVRENLELISNNRIDSLEEVILRRNY